jgi:5'-methylthioadenosine phosphorylase
MAKIGIIGGSGLYEMSGFKVLKKQVVKTPFGNPSDEITICGFEGKEIAFLPRHGRGHTISPTEINYRANIYAMKKLGVERIISVSACGSFKKEIAPCDAVIVDQFVDRTNQARKRTFFEDGIVGHIAFNHPVCKALSMSLFKAAKEAGITAHPAGTYINMEGPAFSTRAESFLYKSWGIDIIGMTNMAEAMLSREAEICFASACFVTDYDAWYASEGAVTVEMVIENFKKNIENSKKMLKNVLSRLPEGRTCECKDALKHAIITNPKFIPAKTKKKLALIIGKYGL